MDEGFYKALDEKLCNEGVANGFELAVTLLGALGMLGSTFSVEKLNQFVEDVARGRRHSRTGQPITPVHGLLPIGLEAGKDKSVAEQVMMGRYPDFNVFID